MAEGKRKRKKEESQDRMRWDGRMDGVVWRGLVRRKIMEKEDKCKCIYKCICKSIQI